jgi:hypothetical protein
VLGPSWQSHSEGSGTIADTPLGVDVAVGSGVVVGEGVFVWVGDSVDVSVSLIVGVDGWLASVIGEVSCVSPGNTAVLLCPFLISITIMMVIELIAIKILTMVIHAIDNLFECTRLIGPFNTSGIWVVISGGTNRLGEIASLRGNPPPQ